MAAPTWAGDFSPAAPAMDSDIDQNDPFVDTDNSPDDDREPPRRYSHLFALGSNASPAQAKRALEAHLAETDRRMEEAGKLGTALVQQRMELAQRLEEVEKLQAEEEITEDLRQKLVEIEKDYNDVARESARAFLPKPRVPSNEAAAGSPFVPEGKGGRRSVSPSKFEAQATGSPTKLSVPNRKLRNQPANRIHDIEFAAEISQSLIVQVRNLQQLLAEREEELRDVKLEKSKLEYDAEGYQQRVKTLDESQNKYKDENWSLETQIHELLAAQRESADREKKLQQTVSILQAEKNAAQRELDEVKLNHAKLSEEHMAAVKHHDTELGAAKRNIVIADSERATLLRKIEDLTGQNQELAKAVSSQRGRTLDRQEILGTSDEDFQTANDNDTPEHSPPPSPIKGTPRHAMLESETLKTSLQHAQRTIQSLRTNVHREKTEKLELRRMLQDARDELEKERSDPAPRPASKRNSKSGPSRDFKKPPRLLGGLRSARSEVVAPEDPEWEDQTSQIGSSPAQPTPRQHNPGNFRTVIESVEANNFDTANETSDQAFETANEQGTETDDFQTGAEEFSSDDAETETDSPSKRNTIRGRPPGLPAAHSRTISNFSTASTEDEYEFDDMRTPTSQIPGLQARFPLRVNRAAFRRSRQASEDPTFQSSPAGFSGSAGGTPQPNQSLAAELGDFDGSDNESNMSATPSKRSIRQVSRPGSIRGITASPPPALPRPRRVTMVDSGMMTEPLSESLRALPVGTVSQERPVSMATVISGISDYSDAGTLNMEENLAKFPSPPTSPPKRDFSFSDVHARDVMPIEESDHHDAELDALRQGHAKQLKDLHNEKDASHAAALAALESQHVDKLDRAIAEARTAHQEELKLLKSGHDKEKTRAAADASAAHARELENLQALHLQQMSQVEAVHKTTLASEVEALKARHFEQLSNTERTRSEAHAAALAALEVTHSEQLSIAEKARADAHAIELESLKANHAEQLSAAEKARVEAHRAEIDALKTGHAEQLDSFKKSREEAHAAELASLVTAHAAQIELAKKELNESHARDLDTLKAAHIAQIETAKENSDASHAEELDRLKATHLSQIDETKNAIAATHMQELEALKAAHATQVEQFKKESEASRVAEIAALAALHAQQLEKSRTDGETKLANELESLKSTHSQQLESFKTQAEENLAKQLQDLKAAHADELDASRAESGVKLAAELDALKLAHSSALELSKTDVEKKLNQEIAALQAEHLKQVEGIRAAEANNLLREVESLKSAHVKDLERVTNERNTVHAAEIAALREAHAKQIDETAAKRDALHAAALAALAATHEKELAASRSEAEATLSREIASLKTLHALDLDKLRSEHATTHAKELESFEAALTKQLESSKLEGDAAHNEQIEALKAANTEIVEAHKRDSQKALEQALDSAKASHERDIEALRSDHAASRFRDNEESASKHATEMAALKAALTAAKTEELDAIATQHEQHMTSLRDEHAAAKVGELDELAARYEKQIERLRVEAAAAKAIALEELVSDHQRQVADVHAEASASKEKELGELTAAHQREINALKADACASREAALAALESKHQERVNALNVEAASANAKDMDDLRSAHATQLKAASSEHSTAIAKLAAELAASHALELEAIRSGHEASRAEDVEKLSAGHASQLTALRQEHEKLRTQELEQLKTDHLALLASAQTEHQATMDAALQDLKASHEREIDTLGGTHTTSLENALSSIKSTHADELANLKAANDAALAQALEKANVEHASALESQQSSIQSRHAKELDDLKTAHDAVLALALEKSNSENSLALKSQQSEILSRHAKELAGLKTANEAALAQALDKANAEHALALETQHSTIQSRHARDLEDLKTANDNALAQSLERATNEHALALETHHAQASAERNKLLATHAAELEALRKTLVIAPPVLGYSSMSTIETEPTDEPEALRSPRRKEFILPRDTVHPQTPETSALGIYSKRGNGAVTPVIAEDETRQSPNSTNSPGTPESQRPFKEISTNTNARPAWRPASSMADHSSQTALTSDGIDRLMLKNRRRDSQDSSKAATGPNLVVTPSDEATPSAVRHMPSQESIGSTSKFRGQHGDSGVVAAPVPVPVRRPGSSGSTRGSQQAMPPLPANHKEVIEAARTGSSQGAKGTMGPPLLPASAYKTQPDRPYSPRDRPLSPMSGRGTPTPRVVRAGSTLGHADVQSPTKMSARSRQSSISSFTSEIDSRFNIRGDMMGASNFAGPNTDPRMIQAITQTMIGEYLWKYTRKAGRGEMSGNRHRRYFWVHPYTRTLYWSDRDPSAAGRSELRAKSIPIEAVRVVSDDNPMPPGLHRKSLVIVSPGRTVKVTCTTGQRHETWFNALSYLLLRTGDEGHHEPEDAAGNITQEDVDEFNPSYGRRSVNSSRRPPPSLSSYNSRTTRNESPTVDFSIPTLTPTHERTTASRSGTLRGLLNRTSTSGSFFNSMRTRSHTPQPQGSAIYEASEVNDSAEELRHIIEQQDRESDRLENVRACCDGKHDVGTLSRSSKRRPSHTHTHSHSHPGQSTTPTPIGTLKAKA